MAVDFRILPEAARLDPEWAVIDRIWNELRTPYEPNERLDELTPGQARDLRADVDPARYRTVGFISTSGTRPAISCLRLFRAQPHLTPRSGGLC